MFLVKCPGADLRALFLHFANDFTAPLKALDIDDTGAIFNMFIAAIQRTDTRYNNDKFWLRGAYRSKKDLLIITAH